jgi:membrane-bound lytic murein transglycosylase D
MTPIRTGQPAPSMKLAAFRAQSPTGHLYQARIPRAWAALCATLLSACAITPSQEAPAHAPVVLNAPALVLPVQQSVPETPPATALPAAPAPEVDDTTAVAGAPTDPLDPNKAIPLNDPSAHTDLWMRVRAGFAMPALSSDIVRQHESWYAGRPDYVQRMTERGGRYLFHVLEEVQSRGMPTELALLPFIESAFNPQAMSSARASGMWQFMPATGRDYTLKQNIFRDDRRDVLASTKAALDYLGRLRNKFGDWHLALAAYNWGEGNVQKAIARNLSQGLPTDYESLRMPAETQHYVPKLQAVKNIIADPAAYGLSLPALDNHPYFLSVPIQRDIDVALTAQLAGLSLDEFKALNPQMNKPVILAAGTEQVLLPYDNVDRFVRNLAAYRGRLASWTAWLVPRTMKPADAARDAGMSEANLREINHIPARMLVKAGSTLLVPRGDRRDHDVSLHLADNAQMLLTPDVPPLRRIAVKARKGDTLAKLAQRYKVNAGQMAQWNKLSPNAKLVSGVSLVVYVPQGKARTAARKADLASSKTASRQQDKRTSAQASAVGKHRSDTAKLAGHGSGRRVAERNGTRLARQ